MEAKVIGELLVSMFVTLDGVVQAPGGPTEDTEGGFAHGGWQAPFFDAASGEAITKDIERMDALLLGRKTYDIFANYWPTAPGDPISVKLNTVPKYVASRTLKQVEWRNSSLLKGDVASEVSRIKQRHGEVHVIGSADLVQSLLKHDLVDRFNLWVYPLVLGTGKRLFAEGTVPLALRLIRWEAFEKGAVRLMYERVGKPMYGDMSEQTPQKA